MRHYQPLFRRPPPQTSEISCSRLRDPATTPTVDTPHLMPAVWTDFFEDVFAIRGHGTPATGHWVNHPLTPTQYNAMKNWAAGNFINDWVGPPSPDTNITPDGLTRAALENCSGGPFFPGIETSFFTRDVYPYVEPFRLDQTLQPDGTQLKAGDLSKQQAIPWQTDFFDCVFQSPLSWWPAAHPDDVFTAASNNYVTWDRGLSNFSDMVNFWSGLGFLVQSGDSVIETERTL
jgi:hypothetical protein